MPGLRATPIGSMMKTNVTLKLMKTMKKYFILLSAAFAFFALASCQKELDSPVETNVEQAVKEGVIPFDLNANILATKTTLNTDSYAVTWQESDVLYAVTTDAAWGDGTSSTDASGDNIATFTYDGDKFSTDMVIAEGSHTFNFIYAGSGQKKYHRATGTTHQLYGTQAVDAENPAQNLKANDALVGQITKTIPATLADITMSHIYTLMKVTIKNKLGETVTANKFEIQIEGEKLYGIFDVAFDTPAATYKSSGDDKITVNITNGSIANNGSIDVYFVMAPVEDFTGNVTFTVTDSNSNTYSKTNTVADLSFTAGSYNTANFTLKPIPAKTFYKITDLSDLETGDYVIIGEKTSSSYGLLTYATLDSKRIPYSQSYNSVVSLPASIETKDGNSIWNLSVSGTSTKSVKVYNEANDKYLKADSGLSYVASGSATSFTVSASEGMFEFQVSTTYLGVNKTGNFWRDYASTNLTSTHGLTLYKYWEESTLSSIAIDPSSTHPTSFYKDDVFSSEGLIVKATYDNGKIKTVSPTSISSPDMTSVADDVVVTVTYTENGITKNTSYTIDILARPIFSVTLNDESTVLTEASAGAGVELPARVAPTGYTFEGWSATEIAAATTTEPTIIATGAYHPTENITLYPVYSYEEEQTVWHKISDLSTVTAGTYALIDSDGYAFNGTITSGHGQSTASAFSFVSNVATSAPAETCELTLTVSGSGFTMYNATNKYLYGSAASSGNLAWHTNETSYWSYTKSNWIYNTNTVYLRTYNHTFRTYGKTSNGALLMAKKVVEDVTYYTSDLS